MNFGVSGVILTLLILITIENVISSDINVTYSEYEEKFEKYKVNFNHIKLVLILILIFLIF